MFRKVLAAVAALALSVSSFSMIAAHGEESKKPITLPKITVGSTGYTFKATPAKWSDNGPSSFKWVLNGKALSASGLTLKLKSGDNKKKLQFSESHLFSDGTEVTAKSNVITIGNVLLSDSLTIRVRPTDDKVMEIAVLPQSVPTSAKPSYQWYAGYFEIKGATKSTYNLKTSDLGTDISVQVNFSAKGFVTAKMTSNIVAVANITREYKQIWSEEFNGPAGAPADPNVWVAQNGDGVAFGNRGWGNKERQWYDDKISSTNGSGSYVIKATKNGAGVNNCYYGGPCEWTSTKIVTKDKVGFKYGRIEARIKGPVGNGTWGAFWMLGANIDERPWPGCGEIDVTELLGRLPNTNLGYIHGPLSAGGGRGDKVEMATPHHAGYHTYAVDWLPDQIRYFLDGVPFATLNKVDKDWVFDHEFYIIINLAMGGNLGGEIEANLKDSSMEFDYIRVYSINGVGEVIKHKA
jgi:beta-glucanase (GH16 family)